MSLKEKFQKAKAILTPTVTNRDYEFEAHFENHPPGNQNIYRLHYINYHRIGERYYPGSNNLVTIDYPFKPFILPKGMSRKEALKILSYLTDYIEKNYNIEPCSKQSVALLDKTLDLERLGFTKLNIHIPEDSPDIIDLFTIDGRIALFTQSKYYPKYFDWYTPDVTLEEVTSIYTKYSIEFYDLALDQSKKKTKKNNHH